MWWSGDYTVLINHSLERTASSRLPQLPTAYSTHFDDPIDPKPEAKERTMPLYGFMPEFPGVDWKTQPEEYLRLIFETRQQGALSATDYRDINRRFGRASNRPANNNNNNNPQQPRGTTSASSPTAYSPSSLNPPTNSPAAASPSPTASMAANEQAHQGNQAPRNPPFFFREKHVGLIVKGNFMTLAAQPVLVENGEWLAHQGKLNCRITYFHLVHLASMTPCDRTARHLCATTHQLTAL